MARLVTGRIGCFEAIKKVAKPKEGQLHFVNVLLRLCDHA